MFSRMNVGLSKLPLGPQLPLETIEDKREIGLEKSSLWQKKKQKKFVIFYIWTLLSISISKTKRIKLFKKKANNYN